MPEPVKAGDTAVAPAQPAKPAAEVKPGQPAPAAIGATPTPGAKPDESQPSMVPLAALQEERNKRQGLQAELEALRKVAGGNMLFDINGNPVSAQSQQGYQPPQQGYQPVQQAPQPQEDLRKKLDEMWESDPRKAVQTEMMMAFQYYDRVNGDLDRAVDDLSSKYSDFGDYRADVLRYSRSLPMEQRSAPVMEAAYFFIKGQRANGLIDRERQEILRKIQAGENVQGLTPGVGSPLQPENKGKLSEDQLRAASAMGMTPEDYLKNVR